METTVELLNYIFFRELTVFRIFGNITRTITPAGPHGGQFLFGECGEGGGGRWGEKGGGGDY